MPRRTYLAALLVVGAVTLRPLCAAEAPPPAAPMRAWQAAVLGLVEGLTEYLPVSSTGHLLLAQRLMGMNGAGDAKVAADAYAVCIQAGAILAVAGIYFRRIRSMLAGLAGRDPAGLRLAANLTMAFLPAAVIGLAIEKHIKSWLFGSGRWGFWPIVAAWFIGGIAILVVDRWVGRRRQTAAGLAIGGMTWRMAVGIGLAQCLAMWPGVSRSLATILGGLLVGLTLVSAAEFSFLLGLATLSASTLLDAVKHGRLILDLYGSLTPALGLLVAMVSAALAVEWMLAYVHKHPLSIFGCYRILLAVGTAALLLAS